MGCENELLEYMGLTMCVNTGMQDGGYASWHNRLLSLLVLCCVVMAGGCQQERRVGPLKTGDQAPDFAVKDLDGDVIVLSSLAGHPVIIRFWDTDCRFCRADTPIFNRYFEKYRDKGLQVIYVSSFNADKKAVQDFIELLEVPFPVVMDNEAKLADLYNVEVYPQTFVIGPDRHLLAHLYGGVGEAELIELIGRFLQ